MTVKGLIDLLRYLPPDERIAIVNDDGVEEFDFARPIVRRYNSGSKDAFAAVHIVVKD